MRLTGLQVLTVPTSEVVIQIPGRLKSTTWTSFYQLDPGQHTVQTAWLSQNRLIRIEPLLIRWSWTNGWTEILLSDENLRSMKATTNVMQSDIQRHTSQHHDSFKRRLHGALDRIIGRLIAFRGCVVHFLPPVFSPHGSLRLCAPVSVVCQIRPPVLQREGAFMLFEGRVIPPSHRWNARNWADAEKRIWHAIKRCELLEKMKQPDSVRFLS